MFLNVFPLSIRLLSVERMYFSGQIPPLVIIQLCFLDPKAA